jgi:hypothetical protein
MAKKYTNIFHFKALQIYPNWDFCMQRYHLATLLCGTKGNIETLNRGMGYEAACAVE